MTFLKIRVMEMGERGKNDSLREFLGEDFVPMNRVAKKELGSEY